GGAVRPHPGGRFARRYRAVPVRMAGGRREGVDGDGGGVVGGARGGGERAADRQGETGQYGKAGSTYHARIVACKCVVVVDFYRLTAPGSTSPRHSSDVIPAEHPPRDRGHDDGEPEQDAQLRQYTRGALAPDHHVLHADHQVAQREDLRELLDPG